MAQTVGIIPPENLKPGRFLRITRKNDLWDNAKYTARTGWKWRGVATDFLRGVYPPSEQPAPLPPRTSSANQGEFIGWLEPDTLVRVKQVLYHAEKTSDANQPYQCLLVRAIIDEKEVEGFIWSHYSGKAFVDFNTVDLIANANPVHMDLLLARRPRPAYRLNPRCGYFLKEIKDEDYADYIDGETKGLVTPLINGRDSGGTGPENDLMEPLVEMEKTVQGTGPGDYIWLAHWFFAPATPLVAVSGYKGARTWGDLFAEKAKEGVVIRLIINDFDPAVPGLHAWVRNTGIGPLNNIIAALPAGKEDNLKYILSLHPAHIGGLKSWLANQGYKNIHIASHHQKFMLVRNDLETTVFCGGLDIEQRKANTAWSYSGLVGWHDLHVKMQGPIVKSFEREFVQRWNRERGQSKASPRPGWKPMETLIRSPLNPFDLDPKRNVHRVQMTRTISTDSVIGPYATARDDTFRAYKGMVACARRFIYMENQYFRSLELADRLVARAKIDPDLILIIVVVQSAAADDGANALTRHGNYLQYEFFRRVKAAFGNRMRDYTMFRRAVHSKFMLVDDDWMTIGSANANKRSFALDSEVGLSIRDSALTRDFRVRLWAHNLGQDSSTVSGWKAADFPARWDAAAAHNKALESTPEKMRGEGIIPFDFESRAKGQRHSLLGDELAELDFPDEREIMTANLHGVEFKPEA